MLKSSCIDTIAKTDIHSAFKRNGLTIKLDGSEDYLVSSWLKASIWNEMKNFRTQLLNSLHPATIKKLEEKIIPPEGVRRKLNGVADGIPPDEEHEILGGEPTDNEWDSDESENESDHETNDTEQLRNTQITDNVVVGDDTDLLVLLLHHADTNSKELFLAPEPKQSSKKAEYGVLNSVKQF